jgi:hypothetical protein
MNNAVAIIVGAVVIAAAILIVFRWQIASPGATMLLDRWTGTVVVCDLIRQQAPAKLNCEPR